MSDKVKYIAQNSDKKIRTNILKDFVGHYFMTPKILGSAKISTHFSKSKSPQKIFCFAEAMGYVPYVAWYPLIHHFWHNLESSNSPEETDVLNFNNFWIQKNLQKFVKFKNHIWMKTWFSITWCFFCILLWKKHKKRYLITDI